MHILINKSEIFGKITVKIVTSNVVQIALIIRVMYASKPFLDGVLSG